MCERIRSLTKRVRLDQLLVQRELAPSRERAPALILAGAVRGGVGGGRADRAAAPVAEDADVAVDAGPKYVSRGGDKLAGALDALALDVAGKVAIDVGSSTGGFTDVLLQRGAVRVHAIDVGKGQLEGRGRAEERGRVAQGGDVVARVKPQCEAGRDAVGKGGVVRDPEARAAAVIAIARDLGSRGFG